MTPPMTRRVVTGETITDEEIRDYARDHWRDPWMGGGPGRGTVGDGMAIALSTSHPEFRARTRAEFARLIVAANAEGWTP